MMSQRGVTNLMSADWLCMRYTGQTKEEGTYTLQYCSQHKTAFYKQPSMRLKPLVTHICDTHMCTHAHPSRKPGGSISQESEGMISKSVIESSRYIDIANSVKNSNLKGLYLIIMINSKCTAINLASLRVSRISKYCVTQTRHYIIYNCGSQQSAIAQRRNKPESVHHYFHHLYASTKFKHTFQL